MNTDCCRLENSLIRNCVVAVGNAIAQSGDILNVGHILFDLRIGALRSIQRLADNLQQTLRDKALFTVGKIIVKRR